MDLGLYRSGYPSGYAIFFWQNTFSTRIHCGLSVVAWFTAAPCTDLLQRAVLPTTYRPVHATFRLPFSTGDFARVGYRTRARYAYDARALTRITRDHTVNTISALTQRGCRRALNVSRSGSPRRDAACLRYRFVTRCARSVRATPAFRFVFLLPFGCCYY